MDLNSSEDEVEPQARVPAANIKAAAGAAAEPVLTAAGILYATSLA